MSFSAVLREHSGGSPDRTEAWEKVFLELQVVLAYSDGVLAPAERMTLSLLSLAKRNELENRHLVDRLIRSIELNGLDQAADRVVGDISALLHQEDETMRQDLAGELLRESIAIVVADDVISEREREFITERLGPALGVGEEKAQDLLRSTSGRLSRARAYVERGYECYLMLAEMATDPPSLNSPDGDSLPGFLGAVDAFVVSNRLGSSRVTAYYLGALGGIFWVDDYEQHLTSLGQLTHAARKISKREGIDGRLRSIHHELDQLRNRGVDAHGFRCVSRHVTNTLGKMAGLSEAQRVFFKDKIAPALEIDHDALLRTASQRRSMVDLNRNLRGECGSKTAEEEAQRWWQFWK